MFKIEKFREAIKKEFSVTKENLNLLPKKNI